MNTSEFLSCVSQHKDNPYTANLASTLELLDEKQLKQMQGITEWYYSCKGFDSYELVPSTERLVSDKSLAVIAQLIEAKVDLKPSGLTYASLLDMPYPELKKTGDSLIQEQLKDFVKENVRGPASDFFSQCDSKSPRETPAQGWKMHIAVRDMADYSRLAKQIIPELLEMGCLFKVVNPEMLDRQMNSIQKGKVFTIYCDESFDINKFSEKSKDMIFKGAPGYTISGDGLQTGYAAVRYGSFRNKCITNNEGTLFDDPKRVGRYAPDFVNAENIFEAADSISKACCIYKNNPEASLVAKFTGDTKDADKNNPYVIRQISPEEAKLFERAVFPGVKDFGQCYVAREKGQDYLMLHKTFVADVFSAAKVQGVDLNDKKYLPSWENERHFVFAPGYDEKVHNSAAAIKNLSLESILGYDWQGQPKNYLIASIKDKNVNEVRTELSNSGVFCEEYKGSLQNIDFNEEFAAAIDSAKTAQQALDSASLASKKVKEMISQSR